MGLQPLPLLLFLAWAASASAEAKVAPGSLGPSPEAALLDWARSRGAEINVHIGAAHEGGARGTLADRDFLPREVVVKVPFNSTVALSGDPFAWAAEHAYEIARRMHLESSFNATFGAWWRSQPSPDELLAPETFPEELLEELQDQDLQGRVKEAQDVGRLYWEGGFEGVQPLNEVIAPAHMTLDTFLYLMGLVATRDFYFYVNGSSTPQVFMVPVIEMLNHADEKGPPGVVTANAHRYNDDVFVYVEALRPIKKGEEITHDYQPACVHRADISFSIYGFVARANPPILCAIDLPHFNSSLMFQPTELTDEEFDPVGHHAIRQEIARVRSILEALPTSLEFDQALLESGQYPGGWRGATVLELRVERKRALLHRVQRLTERLSEL